MAYKYGKSNSSAMAKMKAKGRCKSMSPGERMTYRAKEKKASLVQKNFQDPAKIVDKQEEERGDLGYAYSS